jgi:propanol-preferring alcohol dehydrogenase
MRAWVVERQAPVEQRPMRLADVPTPQPRDDELLVRVQACAVCRTDLHVVECDLPLRCAPTTPGHQVVGEVVASGAAVRQRVANGRVGERVGVSWLHRTCGRCRFCASGRENLCESAQFTGWSVPGGFAEFVVVPDAFAIALPAPQFAKLASEEIAPLLCAGIVGYRALRKSGLLEATADGSGSRDRSPPFRLGLVGFGAAGHLAIQVARARGAEVYVCTRDRERHQALARELGATWVGGASEPPPVKLDASIVFAPAGELVKSALASLERGGRLVLGGIHMTDTPPLPYELMWGERTIATVANHTREDGRDFLAEAARVGVTTHRQRFPFAKADEALLALKNDAVKGAAVLVV